jgi:hypothetical protein
MQDKTAILFYLRGCGTYISPPPVREDQSTVSAIFERKKEKKREDKGAS